MRDWAVGQAGGSCYSQAALSSNDSKTWYVPTAQNIFLHNLGISCYLSTVLTIVCLRARVDQSVLPPLPRSIRSFERYRESLKGSSQVVIICDGIIALPCLQKVNKTQLSHLISYNLGRAFVRYPVERASTMYVRSLTLLRIVSDVYTMPHH